jgi:hypothetical protein
LNRHQSTKFKVQSTFLERKNPPPFFFGSGFRMKPGYDLLGLNCFRNHNHGRAASMPMMVGMMVSAVVMSPADHYQNDN